MLIFIIIILIIIFEVLLLSILYYYNEAALNLQKIFILEKEVELLKSQNTALTQELFDQASRSVQYTNDTYYYILIGTVSLSLVLILFVYLNQNNYFNPEQYSIDSLCNVTKELINKTDCLDSSIVDLNNKTLANLSEVLGQTNLRLIELDNILTLLNSNGTKDSIPLGVLDFIKSTSDGFL